MMEGIQDLLETELYKEKNKKQSQTILFVLLTCISVGDVRQ